MSTQRAGLSLMLACLLIVALVACAPTPATPTRAAPTQTLAPVNTPPPPTATASPTPPPTSTPTPRPAATSTPAASSTPAPTSTSAPKPTSAATKLAPLIVSGDPTTGLIALTFDQGLSGAGDSVRVLDSLKTQGVRATYFLTGVFVQQNPDLVKRIVADGHELGNHSYDHPDLTTVSDSEVNSQMTRTEDLVVRTTSRSTKPYMRPPYGAYDSHLRGLLDTQGYQVVYWTLDSTDWRDDSTVESVVSWVVSKAKAGDIIVFHGYTPKTAAALPPILAGLSSKGFRLGTLSNVLRR